MNQMKHVGKQQMEDHMCTDMGKEKINYVFKLDINKSQVNVERSKSRSCFSFGSGNIKDPSYAVVENGKCSQMEPDLNFHC